MMDITSSRIGVFLSSASHFSCFYWSRKLFLQILVILTLASFPVETFSQCNVSGDITFDVSNSTSDDYCVICDGPWFRTSGLFRVSSGTKDCTFYAAKDGVFSLDGLWSCTLYDVDFHDPSGCNSTESGFIAKREFCMYYLDASCGISLGISGSFPPQFMEGGGYCESQPPCDSSSVSSFLGDNPKQEKSKPDSDVFLFAGVGGDEVTLRLETNPQEGNNGGEANFAISGNSLNESTSGTPPLEINATLPADGKYSITVEQPKNSGQRFRGGYLLSLSPTTGSIDLIEPTSSVEK